MAKSEGKLANRYAKALLRATSEMLGVADISQASLQVADQLSNVAQAWKEAPELSYYVISPMYPHEERLKALLAVAESLGVSDIGKRFLSVVFQRDRINSLPDIISAYKELAEKAAGIVHVNIKTAMPIDDNEKSHIEGVAKQKISENSIFCWEVDPTILGGMIMMFNGKVLDGSLSGKLSKLEETLKG